MVGPVVLPVTSWAQQSPNQQQSEGLRIAIDGRLCRKLTEHVADADVAYRPGVDVRGRPVVAAETGGPKPDFLPDVIEVPVTVDIFERLGQVVGPGVDGKLSLGMVKLDGDKVMFNGIQIGASEDVLLACQGARIR